MKNRILTAKQSGDARDFIGLSQRKVATDAKVNRNMLNLFERQRAVPDDAFLQKLRDYYELNGMDFDAVDEVVELDTPESDEIETSSLPAASSRVNQDLYVRDGFLIPNGINHDEAEVLLEELSVIDERIQLLLEKPVETGLLGDTTRACDSCQAKLQASMARAYCIVRQLHGLEMVEPCAVDAVNEKAEDHGGLLSQWFTLNGVDDDDGQADAA